MPNAFNAPNTTRNSKINPSIPTTKSGTRQLIRWHLAVLGILATVSVGGQIAMQSVLHPPKADTSITAQTAEQQTLSQRVLLTALAIQASETPAQRTTWEANLRETADRWQQSTQTLPRSSAAVTTHLAQAAPAQQAMLDAAHNLLAALPPDTSTQKVDLSRYLTPLFQNQKSYADAMNAAEADYSREAATHLALLKWVQGGLCAVTLLLLIAFALAATRPGRGIVGRTISELIEMEEKKREMDASLSEADRQIAEMRETLGNLSTVDALTGLKNHRAFQEQLDREMGRALRHGHPLSLLLLDIDQFKSYNDSYSHTEGDQALKLVSDLLKETARTSDIPARYGGEEFAIILTETDMMGAVVLGERLRQAVASADGLQRPLTASIGIATLTPSIFSVPAMIAQADRALCHAKGDGRNRVSHAHRIPAPLEDEAPVYARAA
ncbi:MAG: diguanylate cyclase [Janthinobacterium lividum]